MAGKEGRRSGFSIIETIVIIVVIGILGAAGWFVYQYNRPRITGSTGQTNTASQQTGTKTQTDVYAGWKTYCDSVYHYCFKYPKGWTLTASSTAAMLGGTGSVVLLSPTRTVGVTYVNAYTQDSGLLNFMTHSIDKLTSANQDLTIVGGYIPSSGDNGIAGDNVPEYRVVDTSLLNTYPLAVGTKSQFPINPRFTDKNTGNLRFTGRLKAGPSVRINSIDETNTWFANGDVKTALLILKSIRYQPSS